jgi:hypothetical protein
VLPVHWKQRLVRVQNENTNGRIGWCLDPVDLFLAKCVAWREKDREFNKALIDARLVSVDDVLNRLPEMPVDATVRQQIEARVRRLAKAPGQQR